MLLSSLEPMNENHTSPLCVSRARACLDCHTLQNACRQAKTCESATNPEPVAIAKFCESRQMCRKSYRSTSAKLKRRFAWAIEVASIHSHAQRVGVDVRGRPDDTLDQPNDYRRDFVNNHENQQ